MSLMNCPECGKEVYDQAFICPNCGFPLQTSSINENNKLSSQNSYSKKNKTIKKYHIIIVLIIVIITPLAIICIKNYKNKREKRKKYIDEIKYDIDIIDGGINVINTELESPEQFDFYDSKYTAYVTTFEKSFDVILEYQKKVNEAYKNQDDKFIEEIETYITENKTYSSWNEYHDAIDKLLGENDNNHDAAERLVYDLAAEQKKEREESEEASIDKEKVEATKTEIEQAIEIHDIKKAKELMEDIPKSEKSFIGKMNGIFSSQCFTNTNIVKPTYITEKYSRESIEGGWDDEYRYFEYKFDSLEDANIAFEDYCTYCDKYFVKLESENEGNIIKIHYATYKSEMIFTNNGDGSITVNLKN